MLFFLLGALFGEIVNVVGRGGSSRGLFWERSNELLRCDKFEPSSTCGTESTILRDGISECVGEDGGVGDVVDVGDVGEERDDGVGGEEGVVWGPAEEGREEEDTPRGLCGTSVFVSVEEITIVNDEVELEGLLGPQNNDLVKRSWDFFFDRLIVSKNELINNKLSNNKLFE